MLAPDERTFRDHLLGAAYRAGVEEGLWWLLGISWPHAWIAVRAAARVGAPDAFTLRFELSGYPAQAPTATPWDVAANTQAGQAARPKGGRAERAFRTDWESGSALYVPCDRVALAGHPNWRDEHRSWAWDPTKDITLCLRLLSEMLMSDEYAGV